MSSRTLPLLFIDLGGEMLYILDQRLRAQNIPADKAKKVMNDIITTMFNKKFLEELFKPQELYPKKALRTVFDRLAHASIMRLNQASMDKVFKEVQKQKLEQRKKIIQTLPTGHVELAQTASTGTK
uniref:OSCP1 n=1 Tax=Esox lucius TaxID=8010 RepID=C1BZQ6_ESOLU|nr:OSCP1 [Esox lucius]